jgi:hypothetical protein
VSRVSHNSATSTDSLCAACGRQAWWRSVHGLLVCGACHPPASPEFVARFVGTPDG